MVTLRRTRLKLLGLFLAFVFVNILFTVLNIHPVFKTSNFRAANNTLLCVNSHCDTFIVERNAKPSAIHLKTKLAAYAQDGVGVYTKYKVEHLGLKPLRHVRPLRNNFGPVLNDVTSFSYSINAQSQCQQAVNKQDLLVVVVVVSAADHFRRRQLVRQSWAARLRNSTWARHVFLMGKTTNITSQKKIQEEHEVFGDIVQLDMVDSYDILTVKSVALLHWAENFCLQVPFFMKCDDDVYVNSDRLATAISAIQREIPYYQAGLYGTKIIIDNPPQRKLGSYYCGTKMFKTQILIYRLYLESKHYVSLEVWPWPTYPSYLYGGCYLVGRGSLGPLLAAAQTTPFFPFEDLYLIGLCSRKAQIPLWTFDK